MNKRTEVGLAIVASVAMLGITYYAITENNKIEKMSVAARIAQAEKIDEENRQRPIQVSITPSTPAKSKDISCMHPKGWAQIGMDKEEVIRCGWGKPDKINRYTNSYGTREQWVYRTRIEGYLYFDSNGKLQSMSH